MMTRVKLGMAVAIGLGLGLGGPASAQLESNFNLQTAVGSLSDTFGFSVGATGNQAPGGNPNLDCPGAVEGGDEDIYDFDQDGIPDYAQMALIEAYYNANHPTVRAALDRMTDGLKRTPIVIPPGSLGPTGCDPDVDDPCVCADPLGTGTDICGQQLADLVNALSAGAPLPGLLELLSELLLDLEELGLAGPENAAARNALFLRAIDALSVWGSIDNPANFQRAACIDELVGLVVGLLVTLYEPASESNLSSVVNGSVVLGDGETILDKWLEASGGKSNAIEDPEFLATVAQFVSLVLAADGGDPVPIPTPPFPPAPPGSPVAAPLGLALLAAGLGFAAIRRSRRA